MARPKAITPHLWTNPLNSIEIADKHRIFFENEEDEKNDRRNMKQYVEDRFSSLTTSIGEKPKFVGNLAQQVPTLPEEGVQPLLPPLFRFHPLLGGKAGENGL